ncbi:MAG TPA: putative sugar nucleotidyl transferase [candidate division Zixibacteria bacterium]|nr:putative sugar nucleotidyl transferase [candidate division Zixibacteria bacterium]
MSLQLCVYEDSKFAQFNPIAHTRPVFCLRAGIGQLFERALTKFKADGLALACRNHLAPLVADEQRDYPVNIIKRGDGDLLLLNGRLRSYGNLPQLVKEARVSTRFFAGDEVAAVFLTMVALKDAPPIGTPDQFAAVVENEGEQVTPQMTTATLYNHLWDIVGDVEHRVTEDFRLHRPNLGPAPVKLDPRAFLVNDSDIYLAENVEVCPGALLDASHGPIFIDRGTRVESQAAIYGPTYVGPNSVIVAGKIQASCIGPTCRVGGELEESVLQGYVNKYHAGFIGHSYVGSWVNFGAMTTNSDLKNNYSNIRSSVNGQMIDTGSIKVGSFIGDHTKFGIGTLLNTGINIGVCCNIFGGTLIVDKEVPSFSWGGMIPWHKYTIGKALETAQRTTERRMKLLSPSEIEVLQKLAAGEEPTEGYLDL